MKKVAIGTAVGIVVGTLLGGVLVWHFMKPEAVETTKVVTKWLRAPKTPSEYEESYKSPIKIYYLPKAFGASIVATDTWKSSTMDVVFKARGQLSILPMLGLRKGATGIAPVAGLSLSYSRIKGLVGWSVGGYYTRELLSTTDEYGVIGGAVFKFW